MTEPEDMYLEFLQFQKLPPDLAGPKPVLNPVAPDQITSDPSLYHGVGAPALGVTLPDPVPGEPVAEEQGLMGEFWDYLDTVQKTVRDSPDALGRGAVRGVMEGLYAADLVDDQDMERFRALWDFTSDKAVEFGVNETASGMLEGVGQIATGALPVFKVLKVAGMGRAAAAVIAEGLGGAFAVNPDDPNLANMAQEFMSPQPGGQLFKALEIMATNPDDPAWQNRARNAIQDSALGLAFEALLKIPGAARAMVERFREGKSPVPMGMSIEDVSRDGPLGPAAAGDPVASGEVLGEAAPDAVPGQINIDQVEPGAIPAPDGSPANTFLRQEEPVFITGTSGARKNLVAPEDIARFWDADYAKRHGGPGDINNPADYSRAVDTSASEMDYQLQQIESGEGWYDADIKKTRAIVNKVFPEMKQNPLFGYNGDGNGIAAPYMHQLLTAIAAPLSFNNRPKPNMDVAMKVFDIFLEEGRIPVTNPETGKLWTSRSSGKQGLIVLQHMIDEMGVKGTMRWLFKEQAISDIRNFKISSGAFTQTTGSMGVPGVMTDKKLGAYIIGQKGGSFFLNLNGVDDTTSDLWDTRNFNRQFGRMMHDDGSLMNQPRGPEREIQKQFNRDVGNQFGKNERDSQAIRWYYEQNLNYSMGQKSARPSKFSDGAIQFRDSTLRRADRDGGANVQPRDVDAVRRSGSGNGGSN